MFMTDATRERSPAGRTPQSCKGTASRGRSVFRCCRAPGTGLLHFDASGVPLSGTSSAPEGAGRSTRNQTGIYGQAPTQFDAAGPNVRGRQRIVDQRCGQPSVARIVTTRARAWVSRRQLAYGAVGWNIDLIVCCRTNWRKFISYWYRRSGGQSKSEKDLWHRQSPPWR